MLRFVHCTVCMPPKKNLMKNAKYSRNCYFYLGFCIFVLFCYHFDIITGRLQNAQKGESIWNNSPKFTKYFFCPPFITFAIKDLVLVFSKLIKSMYKLEIFMSQRHKDFNKCVHN